MKIEIHQSDTTGIWRTTEGTDLRFYKTATIISGLLRRLLLEKCIEPRTSHVNISLGGCIPEEKVLSEVAFNTKLTIDKIRDKLAMGESITYEV